MTETLRYLASNANADEDTGVFTRETLSSFPPPVIEAPASTRTTRPPLYRVIVAADLSALSQAVFAEGICFARAHAPAELHVVTVAKAVRHMLRLPNDETKAVYTPKQLQQMIAKSLQSALGERRPSVEGVFDDVVIHVVTGDVAGEILRLADDLLADLIVLGAHDRTGIGHRMWGSISRSVVSRATASVVLCRPPDFDHGEPVPALAMPRLAQGFL